MVVGAVAGSALAAFGVAMLVTGKAPQPTAKAFRSVRDAGFYHLLFGVGLGVVVVGTGIDHPVLTVGATVVAVLLVGLALVRFRPRGRHRPLSDSK